MHGCFYLITFFLTTCQHAEGADGDGDVLNDDGIRLFAFDYYSLSLCFVCFVILWFGVKQETKTLHAASVT